MKKRRKKVRYNIYLKEILFFLLLLPFFKSLNLGTINEKAWNFADITVKIHPDFMFEHYKGTEEGKFEYVLKKGRIFFSNKKRDPGASSRAEAFKLKDPEYYEECLREVADFISNISEHLKDSPSFQKHHKDFEFRNDLSGKHCSALTRQFYVFDTTQISKRLLATFLIDLGSHKIVSYILTDSTPSASRLMAWFREYFTPDLKERVLLIHGDRSGANISLQFLTFLEEMGIRMSFSTPSHKRLNENQQAESTNKMVKDNLHSRRPINVSDSIKFEDYPYETRKHMLEAVLESFALTYPYPGYLSNFLQGQSRNQIDSAKEYFFSLFSKDITGNFFIATSQGNDGMFINAWNIVVVSCFKIVLKQEILYHECGIVVPIISDSDFSEVLCALRSRMLDRLKNIDRLENIKKILLDKEKFLDDLIEEVSSFKNEGLNFQCIKEKLCEKLEKEVKEEKDDIKIKQIQLKISFVNLQGPSDVKSNVDVFEKMQAEHFSYLLKKIMSEKNQDEIPFLVLSKNALRRRVTFLLKDKYRVVKKKEYTPYRRMYLGSIFCSEWDVIVGVLTENGKGEINLRTARCCLANLFYRLFGISFNNLTNLDFDQVRNFFNGKDVIIKISGKEGDNYVVYPPIPAFKKLAKPFIPYYEFFEDMIKTGEISQFVDEKGIIKIWGNVGRSGFEKAMRKKLKLASAILKSDKRFTPRSYRNGIALQIIRIYGLSVAQFFFGRAKVITCEDLQKLSSDKGQRKFCKKLQELSCDKKRRKHILEEIYSEKNKIFNYQFDTDEALEQLPVLVRKI